MTDNTEDPVVDIVEPDEAPAREPRRLWPFGKEKQPPRPLLVRLFGISIWGAVKLAVICVIVGFFVLAANFDPAEADVNVGSAILNALSSAVEAAGWTVRNFWKPALAGATLVLPIWILWRLATLPFRR